MKNKMFHSLFTVALCCAAAVLYSCKDDDDNGVEPAPARKLVSRLTLTTQGENAPHRTCDFSYFPDGALAEATLYERFEEDTDTLVLHFSRRDGRLILSSEGSSQEEVYLLNDEGYIVMTDPWALLHTKFRLGLMTFDYANGFLKSITVDGVPSISYVWVHGDMVSSINREDQIAFYSYTTTENKMNIDPTNIFFDMLNGSSLMSPSGYCGAISKHLPAELMFLDDDYTQYTLSFTYTFDSGGYPMSISALEKWKGPNIGTTIEQETIVQLSYVE